MCDLFIFAGEPSGDLHGERVLKTLLEENPHLRVAGVGGPRMRALGMEVVLPMEDFQVMGFVDVFLALPKLIRQFYFIRKTILQINPQTVLFIDYPGFNLRMAAHLRKKGYEGKICHYICPSVWAWGKKRIPQMAKNLDLLLTILPFEKKLFSHTSLQVEYVGHPLIERIAHYPYQDLHLPKGRIVGIFPGSRLKEIKRNLPLQLKVAKRFPDLHFALSVGQPRFLPLLEKLTRESGIENISFVEAGKSYDLMKVCDLAIAKSGTVTLELALHGVPTIVTYGISKLDLFIAQRILGINLPFYCLVNIIAGYEVFPELIGPYLTEEALFNALNTWISAPSTLAACRNKCFEVRKLLEETPHERIAFKTHIL